MSSLTARPASKHSSISTSVPSGHFSADDAGHRKYRVGDGDEVGLIEDDVFHCWKMEEDVVVAVAVGACCASGNGGGGGTNDADVEVKRCRSGFRKPRTTV